MNNESLRPLVALSSLLSSLSLQVNSSLAVHIAFIVRLLITFKMGSRDETTESIETRWWRPPLRDIVYLSVAMAVVFSMWNSHQSFQQYAYLPELTYPEWPVLQERTPTKKTTIAYAVTLTECHGTKPFLDVAAVLQHSIRRFDAVSSKYDSKLYAFVHPDASNCTENLRRIGYEVQIRPTPINVTDIRGELKDHVHGACCGAAEFLKLYSYVLSDHKIVVHLDMDVVVLQPLDDLFDSMLEGPDSPARSRLPAMWVNNVTELPREIDAFFTRDYNMLAHRKHRKPIQSGVQGGFLVVRPNQTVFQTALDTILEGNYSSTHGWGGPTLRYGGYYGAAQIQGLLPFLYGHLFPGTSVELNRCIYNTMADDPNDRNGECFTPAPDGSCEDCRETNISLVKTAHFTLWYVACTAACACVLVWFLFLMFLTVDYTVESRGGADRQEGASVTSCIANGFDCVGIQNWSG